MPRGFKPSESNNNPAMKGMGDSSIGSILWDNV